MHQHRGGIEIQRGAEFRNWKKKKKKKREIGNYTIEGYIKISS